MADIIWMMGYGGRVFVSTWLGITVAAMIRLSSLSIDNPLGLSQSTAIDACQVDTARASFNLRKVLSGVLLMMLAVSPAYAASPYHEACLRAVDYAGCVKTLSGEGSTGTAPIIRIDQTNRPGLLSETGNQCPVGYGYAGGGRCRSVVCKGLSIFGRNQQELAGKGHKCGGGAEALNQGILWGRGTLAWGNDYVNASFNPACPLKEMNIGDLSTCSAAGVPEAK